LREVVKETRVSFEVWHPSHPGAPAALSIERGKILNGRKVLVIRTRPHLRVALFIPATGTPYPLLQRGYGRYAGYSVTYDRWNRPVKIDQPPDNLPMSDLGRSR
jgi:hypothetical protein